MIPQTSSELLKNLILITDQNLHSEAFVEYFKLKESNTTTKFKLKKIYHEQGDRTYVWRLNDYFAINQLGHGCDTWSLNQLKPLEQLKMPI